MAQDPTSGIGAADLSRASQHALALTRLQGFEPGQALLDTLERLDMGEIAHDEAVALALDPLRRAGVPLPAPSELVAAMAAGIPDVAAPHPYAGLLGPFYSSGSVRRLLGVPSKQALDDRRRRWTVLAAQTSEGTWVYPSWQFDAEHARVHRWLAPVLRGLRGAPRWGAALWLVTEHPDLNGQAPREAAEHGTADQMLIGRLAGQYVAAVSGR